MKVKYLDPPNGWRYGFPRIVPNDVTDLRQWLLDNGYPEKDVDFALKYSRYWFKEEKEND